MSAGAARPRIARVLPDVAAIDKTFDYLVPEHLGDQVRVGTMVRIALHGRRVGGWVTEVDPPDARTDLRLQPLAKVTGWGPAPDLVDLATWAAWRWAGRRSTLLATASPQRAVPSLPPPAPPAVAAAPLWTDELQAAFVGGVRVLRLPPASDLYPVAIAAVALGNALVLSPSVASGRHLATRLRRAGVVVAHHPEGWAQARAGATVVGARAAVWAPVVDLAAIVVIDEHDETWQEERAPTWHVRDVAIERARRAGVPCVLVSPMPTLEAQAAGPLVTIARQAEREGWPVLDIVDRRDDGQPGLFSERFVSLARDAEMVVCVLNRKGRSRLLACAACGELARCERCDGPVGQDDDRTLVCRRCFAARPPVCASCGGLRLKNLVQGVTRATEELEALLRRPVQEVTGANPGTFLDTAGVVMGTEAVFHHVRRADLVAFVDFDQELLAPRLRAGEEALALLVRAGRLVGGRGGGGRVLVQCRHPQHEVLTAALHGDPSRHAIAEQARRIALTLPPYAAIAEISGAAAEAFVSGIGVSGSGTPGIGMPLGVSVVGPRDGRWLLRAPDHTTLCDTLAATPRPGGRLRISVDPLRI